MFQKQAVHKSSVYGKAAFRQNPFPIVFTFTKKQLLSHYFSLGQSKRKTVCDLVNSIFVLE